MTDFAIGEKKAIFAALVGSFNFWPVLDILAIWKLFQGLVLGVRRNGRGVATPYPNATLIVMHSRRSCNFMDDTFFIMASLMYM
jgi:hypothetical protein